MTEDNHCNGRRDYDYGMKGDLLDYQYNSTGPSHSLKVEYQLVRERQCRRVKVGKLDTGRLLELGIGGEVG